MITVAAPKYVDVMSLHIKVVLVKNLFRDYERYGEYSTCEMTIFIDADLSEQRQELTFCHELWELLKDVFSLDIDHTAIQPMAVFLHDLIKSNRIQFTAQEQS